MKPTKLPLWKDKRIHWKKFFDQVEAGQSFVLPINHRQSFSTLVNHYRPEFGCETEDLGNGYFSGRIRLKDGAPMGAPTWSLHVGFIKLFITGPGQDQWFAVSSAHYRGPVGTPDERETAEKVVDYLNFHHRHDETMGRQDIDELLRRFAPRRTRQLAAR